MPLPPRVGKRRKQHNSVQSFQRVQKADLGSSDMALAASVAAVEGGSTDVDVYLKLSKILSDKRQYPEALAICQQGLKVCGVHPALLGNQGAVFCLLGRYEEALRSAQQQAAMLPPEQQPWNNLGNIYRNLGRVKESIGCFERALQFNGDDADAHYNLGLTLLVCGDYRNGFREYEWRPAMQNGFPFHQPRWDGRPLNGKRILLCQEQGMGDVIQFVRYAPLVRDQGGQALLGVAPALERLLGWMRGGFELARAPETPFDVFCPILSLPLLCGAGEEPIPPPAVFDIPQEFKEKWCRLLIGSSRPKVGLVWAGSPSHQNDVNRSLGLEALLPLLQRDEACFFSLQVGDARSAIQQQGLAERIVDLSPHLTDYAETAAAISQLDLVITVDTSVAHLAGTLGVPTWMMIPFAPDWRWLLNRSDSPWYGSLRIFRQKKAGDWPGVVSKVVEALPDFVRKEKPASAPALLSGHTDMERWSNPANLLPSWNARARIAADFIPSGATVLDIGCGAMALEQFLPPGCSYAPCDVVKRDERTSVCDLNAGQLPSAQNATHISMLGVLEYVHDWQNLLRQLRAFRLPLILSYCPTDFTAHLDRPALGWINHLSLQDLCSGLSEVGFQIQTSLRVDANQILIRAVPETVRVQPKRRVLVMSYNNCGNFGDRLGFHLINSLLPAEAEVHYANYKPWNVQDQNYDLVILGTGHSLFQPILTEQLLSLVRRVPRTVGIFGTQYREGIDRALLGQILDELTVWFARHEEDLLLYGKGRQNALHLGDWLLSAFPMTRWTKDGTLRIGKEIWNDLPLDRTIQNIQQYRHVFSERIHPLLCALASAEQVAYTEQRECGGAVSSGKFRSMFLDIFGRTWPESTAFEFDRAAVAGYRSRVMKLMSGMPQLFAGLLGLEENAAA